METGARSSANQAQRDASEFDRVVPTVTVTDPCHPLNGRTCELVRPVSSRGKAMLTLRLPDGQLRSVPRAATDIDGHSQVAVSREGPLISVRTLLPVARLVRLMITATEEVACDVALRSGSTSTAAAPVPPSPSHLASAGARSPDAARPASGHVDSPHPYPAAPERGDAP